MRIGAACQLTCVSFPLTIGVGTMRCAPLATSQQWGWALELGRGTICGGGAQLIARGGTPFPSPIGAGCGIGGAGVGAIGI